MNPTSLALRELRVWRAGCCVTKSAVWIAEPEDGFGAPKLSVAFWGALFGFVGSVPDVTLNHPMC